MSVLLEALAGAAAEEAAAIESVEPIITSEVLARELAFMTRHTLYFGIAYAAYRMALQEAGLYLPAIPSYLTAVGYTPLTAQYGIRLRYIERFKPAISPIDSQKFLTYPLIDFRLPIEYLLEEYLRDLADIDTLGLEQYLLTIDKLVNIINKRWCREDEATPEVRALARRYILAAREAGKRQNKLMLRLNPAVYERVKGKRSNVYLIVSTVSGLLHRSAALRAATALSLQLLSTYERKGDDTPITESENVVQDEELSDETKAKIKTSFMEYIEYYFLKRLLLAPRHAIFWAGIFSGHPDLPHITYHTAFYWNPGHRRIRRKYYRYWLEQFLFYYKRLRVKRESTNLWLKLRLNYILDRLRYLYYIPL